jgi:VanZ family protein
MRPHRSLSGLLAAVYLLLLVYASLYPFEGWTWPAGASLKELAVLEWPPWRNRFDEWANLLGYLPFGAVLFAMVVRNGGSTSRALFFALLAPALLSYTLEVLQNFIPRRFPSMRDWVNNCVGAVLGALLCWLAQATGWLDVWQRLRERWFAPQSAPAVALLLLWPVGLLFPAPVPLGMGQIGPELREMAEWAVADTPLAAYLRPFIEPNPAREPALGAAREALAIGLGLLAPCLLACVVTRPGWRRWLLAPGAATLAIVVMTLSTALNFGPDHAWTWMSSHTLEPLAMATLAGMLLAHVGPRVCASLSLVALTAMVTIVATAPSDPYYAASLQGWEQGRFIRFHGLAHWVGLLWPYAAMAWLLNRLARRS